MTPGPCLCLFIFFALSFFFPFLPSPLVHAHLLPVSLCAVSFPPAPFLSFTPCAVSLCPSPLLYSHYPPQPHRPDLLPLLDEERGFCLPPAVVTWCCAQGDRDWRTCSLYCFPTFQVRGNSNDGGKKQFESGLLYRESCFFSGSTLFFFFFYLMLATLAVDNNVSLSCYMSA